MGKIIHKLTFKPSIKLQNKYQNWNLCIETSLELCLVCNFEQGPVGQCFEVVNNEAGLTSNHNIFYCHEKYAIYMLYRRSRSVEQGYEVVTS